MSRSTEWRPTAGDSADAPHSVEKVGVEEVGPEESLSRRTLRFLQASRLWVDHQLAGAGSVPDDWLASTRDASVIAWHRLVDVCIEQNVDFLLIGGDAFDDRDEGLRGQIELTRGFRRLAEHGIPVFLTAGATDAWTSWLPALPIPDNVTRLGLDCGSRATVYGRGEWEGLPIAEVQAIQSLLFDESEASDDHSLPGVHRGEERGVPQIAMIRGGLTSPNDGVLYGSGLCYPAEDLHRYGIDYWAFSGHHAGWNFEPFTGSIANDAGGTQGFHPDETGPRGATLVTIYPEGRIETQFIPTAPVRWERLTVRISESTDYDDLVRDLRLELQNVARLGTDRLWLVTWDVRGAGPLYEQFLDMAWRARLTLDLYRQPGVPEVAVWSVDWKLAELAASAAAGVSPHPFVRNYVEAATAAWTLPAGTAVPNGVSPASLAAREILRRSPVRGGAWDSRIEPLLAAVDTEEVQAAVRRWGARWFNLDDAA